MLPSLQFTFAMCAAAYKDAKNDYGSISPSMLTMLSWPRGKLPGLNRGALFHAKFGVEQCARSQPESLS